MIEAIKVTHSGDLSEPVSRVLLRVKKAAEELWDMVGHCLELARSERGERIAETASIDPRVHVVLPAVEHVQPLMNTRNTQLGVSYSEPFIIEADAEPLRLALGNYLSNAAKYAHEGVSPDWRSPGPTTG